MPLPSVSFAEIGASAWVGEQAGQGERSSETGTVVGVGVRLRPSERWAIELRGGHGPSGWDPSVDAHAFVGNASADIVPSLVVGSGWESAAGRPFGAVGGGLDVQLHDRVDLRADTRLRVGLRDGTASLLFTVGMGFHASRRFDLDDDGLADRNDRCPDDPEDMDGHDDGDGCPERDNDLDGIADREDRCPDVPEDRDGFLDADGCPEPDNDGDGLDDARDLCIAAAEDRDGFQDADGCPDLDDDADGRADGTDACPRAAEDRDGFQDEDGCPDLDNDADGIPDTVDAAPDAAENRNGWEDDDGAPDVLPRVLARFVGPLARVRFEPDPARRAQGPQAPPVPMPEPMPALVTPDTSPRTGDAPPATPSPVLAPPPPTGVAPEPVSSAESPEAAPPPGAPSTNAPPADASSPTGDLPLATTDAPAGAQPVLLPAKRLTERARETLETLADVLDTYPRVRIQLEVAAPRPGQAEARGALLVAALSAEGIDPQRVRLVAQDGPEGVTLSLVP